jgi:hypothetical protein
VAPSHSSGRRSLRRGRIRCTPALGPALLLSSAHLLPTTSRGLSKLLATLAQMWRRCPSPASRPRKIPFHHQTLPRRYSQCAVPPVGVHLRNCVNQDAQEKLVRDQLDQQVRNPFKSPLIHGIVSGSRFG